VTRIRIPLSDPKAEMEVSLTAAGEEVPQETLDALRKVGEAALMRMKQAAESRATRHMSIREREEWWLAKQNVADLRRVIYEAFPIVVGANDLEHRKPYLALEKLIALASTHSHPGSDA
jgi:hypothetical protein